MKYIEEEWNRVEMTERLANLAFNIKVIRASWSLQYPHGYGEKKIAENRNNPENLYGSLERSQETLRQMERQTYKLKKDSLFKWAKHIEEKTGIPGEYLTGQEMIDLCCVGGSGKEEYDKYFDKMADLYDTIEELKSNESNKVMNKNMKLTSEKAKKMNLREMKIYIDKCSMLLSDQIERLASDAQQSINFIKEYDEKLKECIKKLLSYDFEIKLEKDEKLYRLVYYIFYGKKSGTGDSIAQIIKILKNKRTNELKNAGEELLYRYIMTLREQLKLAESVYIVASDCGDFNNEKNLKNIL